LFLYFEKRTKFFHLRENLKTVGDLERFVNRINYKTRTNARELLNIKNSLDIIPQIISLLQKAKIPEITKFIDKIKSFDEIQSLIEVSIKEGAPTTVKEGNLIKEGFNEKVDELRDIINNGKKYIFNDLAGFKTEEGYSINRGQLETVYNALASGDNPATLDFIDEVGVTIEDPTIKKPAGTLNASQILEGKKGE